MRDTKILHIAKCSILNIRFIVITAHISFLIKALAIFLVAILSLFNNSNYKKEERAYFMLLIFK